MLTPPSALPCHGGPVIGVRPQTLGNAIRAAGTAGFADAVAGFVNESIVIDAIHLERWRPDPGVASGYLIEWFGSWGDRHHELCVLMDAYYRDFWQTDPLVAPVRGTNGTLLLQRHVGGLPDGDFRRRFFDEQRVTQECMLVHGNANVQYALSITRSTDHTAFSRDELFHLRQMADLLFPLLDMHARSCAARRIAPAAGHAPSHHGFDTRVARQDVRLSRREQEICKLLLSGRSVPEAAALLDIRHSTAETYVKRAFAKLGLRTRGELFDWALLDG
ncbi:helix-turn-helix transcriptional regulator [Burkholderia cepacia]|uniref:helix-turn-helix transcriptional regulator n=1 Tax=Burkholderia cepacia TaxID=292 RepID=UPI00249EEB94|nr:helix-turn-helix transcriptional regulator [Burkholderia cepacia]WGY69679.1 helix-turn-helix transcriptional regulator [Burkholderia cepacia]